MGTLINTQRKVLEGGGHVLTSPFGTRTLNGKTSTHQGVDLVGKGYTLDYIVAYDDGTVTAALNTCSGKTPSMGNYVQIKHNDGAVSIYMHMKRGSVTVQVGDKVKRGQRLGFMGNTGNSTGAHLHFGLQVGGKYVDPLPYLQGGVGGDTVNVTLNKIRPGAKGEQVKTLQRLLGGLGYKGADGRVLAVDGSMGPNSTHAMKAFQKAKKLHPDGVVGVNTWRAILGA